MYRMWENFGEFGEGLAIRQNFSHQYFINARIFNILPTDSPKFSSPKTLEPLIRQNFPPPKFSYVWYKPFLLIDM